MTHVASKEKCKKTTKRYKTGCRRCKVAPESCKIPIKDANYSFIKDANYSKHIQRNVSDMKSDKLTDSHKENRKNTSNI